MPSVPDPACVKSASKYAWVGGCALYSKAAAGEATRRPASAAAMHARADSIITGVAAVGDRAT